MLERSEADIVKNWKTTEGNRPVVSIRCTTFNQEKYIAKCLDGFLIQETDFPFEICVHDDASKDSTASIVKEYAAKYPRVIKALCETENQWSKQDGSFTRIVTSMLTGKYVAMCEGDDYWVDPQKLQQQVDFLESHPDYSMVFHDAIIKNEPGVPEKLDVYPPMDDRDYSATEMFAKWTVPTASMVYRREVLDFKLKRTGTCLNGDIYLVEKCAAMGRVRCINKKMSVYRRQPSGVTWDESRKIQRLLKYPLHYQGLKENFPGINTRLINRSICTALWNAVPYQTFPKKISSIFKAFLLSPKHFIKIVCRKRKK